MTDIDHRAAAPAHHVNAAFAPLIAALGHWPGAAIEQIQDEYDTVVVRLDRIGRPTDAERVRRLFAGRAAPWLLLGSEVDEQDAVAMADLAYGCATTLRLAVLGSADDVERADWWLRYGADAYLVEDRATPHQLMRALTLSSAGYVVVDRRCRGRRASAGPILTTRQRETLALLSAGLSNDAIARALQVNRRTVEFHVTAIFDKLGVRSRVEAALRARELGL